MIASSTNKIVSALKDKRNENLDLYKLSIRDELTDLYNRRFFDETIEREVSICLRDDNATLSFLMIDIDHFKSFNDNHGHDTGDYVLKKIATCLLETIRKTDMVFRYGGEEFCVLLLGSGRGDALLVAQKLLGNFRNLNLVYNDTSLNITASIGASSFNEQTSNAQNLIKAADIALYQAKNNGRNQITVAD